MNIVTTMTIIRQATSLRDPKSQRIAIRDAVVEFLQKVALAFGLPSSFLGSDAS